MIERMSLGFKVEKQDVLQYFCEKHTVEHPVLRKNCKNRMFYAIFVKNIRSNTLFFSIQKLQEYRCEDRGCDDQQDYRCEERPA